MIRILWILFVAVMLARAENSPLGFEITERWKDGICDIRGDCWWSWRYCHGCGVNGTYPLVTNQWADYLVPEFKVGTIIYVPDWPKLPIPKELQ
jgi:hypothetical protein